MSTHIDIENGIEIPENSSSSWIVENRKHSSKSAKYTFSGKSILSSFIIACVFASILVFQSHYENNYLGNISVGSMLVIIAAITDTRKGASLNTSTLRLLGTLLAYIMFLITYGLLHAIPGPYNITYSISILLILPSFMVSNSYLNVTKGLNKYGYIPETAIYVIAIILMYKPVDDTINLHEWHIKFLFYMACVSFAIVLHSGVIYALSTRTDGGLLERKLEAQMRAFGAYFMKLVRLASSVPDISLLNELNSCALDHSKQVRQLEDLYEKLKAIHVPFKISDPQFPTDMYTSIVQLLLLLYSNVYVTIHTEVRRRIFVRSTLPFLTKPQPVFKKEVSQVLRKHIPKFMKAIADLLKLPDHRLSVRIALNSASAFFNDIVKVLETTDKLSSSDTLMQTILSILIGILAKYEPAAFNYFIHKIDESSEKKAWQSLAEFGMIPIVSAGGAIIKSPFVIAPRFEIES